MFCAIQAATRAGIRENEDAVWAQRDFLFVIDGATGLSGENYMDPVSDARWFAGTTARLLRDMLPENGPLPEILRGAMERVRPARGFTMNSSVFMESLPKKIVPPLCHS